MGAQLNVNLQDGAPFPLNVQLSCAAGEILALVGPSGSGKSRVLRCIAGLYRPKHGKITFGDVVWYDAANSVNRSPQQRQIGIVFQNYALFPHLSAIKNVMEALGDRPYSERCARAAELLNLVNLGGLANRKPTTLSGGQQQRVAVARALARDPNVLLLDEPFSAVDKATRQRLYRELTDLRRQLRMPVVLVTHDLDEAALLADRLCILHHGKTLQEGPPFDVMVKPATPEIARLVGLKNTFEGRVIEHEVNNNRTFLGWGTYTLVTSHQPNFLEGSTITWTIPNAQVILHRPDRPSRGENENPVSGIIVEFVPLGDQTNVAIAVDGVSGLRLFMNVPTHVAQRNDLAVNKRISVSLLATGIHLIPLSDDA
jgi:molybdate transport system ATP-binding protein